MPSDQNLAQSASKKHVTILVGAGQSQALGLAGTDQITRAVDATLVNVGGDEYIAVRASMSKRFGPLVNFEVIASALETHLLFDHSRSVLGEDGVPSYSGYDTIAEAITMPKHPMALGKARKLYDQLMRTVVDLTSVSADETSDRFASVAAFYSAISSYARLDIATLNYDQVLEQLFPDVVDGFVDEADVRRIDALRHFSSRELLAADDRIRLAHLHGSNRWGFWDDQIYCPINPKSARRWQVRGDGVVASTMVTGEGKATKLVTSPYNHYYHWLAQRLYESPRLLIIGYGAGDQHINAAVHAWGQHHGEAARMVLIDKFDGYPPLAVRALAMFALGSTDMEASDLSQEMYGPFRRMWILSDGFPPSPREIDSIMEFLD